MKKPAQKDELVDAMNELAKTMIAGSRHAGSTNQVEIFSAVTKWIAVKNRLNMTDEADGSRINAYRDALADTPAPGAVHRHWRTKHPARNEFRNVDIRKKATDRSNERQGNFRRFKPGDGGPDLDAIKRRLPDANGSGALDDRADALSSGPTVTRRRGRIRPGVLDAAKPDDDGAGGEPSL